MKNIMRARVEEKVGKLTFIISRSRTVDDIRIIWANFVGDWEIKSSFL